MKKFSISLLVATTLICLYSSKAQTVDEVIDNYVNSLGGKEKLMSLKSVKMTGNLNVQGYDVGVTVTIVQGVGSRNDISVPGMGEGFQVVNQTKGWNFMPFQGQTIPEEISQEQVISSQGLLDLQGALFNYKEKGSQVELLGKETIGGAECYKLKLKTKSGKITTYFIDAKTWYRVKSISKMTTPNGEEDVETVYSDFKKTDEGYVFPFSQTNPRGIILYSSIETNKPVDEKIFTVN